MLIYSYSAFDNVVMVLPELSKDDAIYAFMYGFKPHLKGFVKV